MLAQQRYAFILEQLKQNEVVYSSALVSQLGVSSETVRKDLDVLEQAGRLVRIHGGAIPAEEKDAAQPEGGEYISFQMRDTQHREQKAAIAARAARLIREGQVIALDYGSTSQMMAQELKKHFKSLTVITNSVQNAMILSECPDFTIIMTGGVFNKDEYTLVNDFTSTLDLLHIDIFFMTATGVDPVIGCTDQRLAEARVQNQMRRSASQTVVLADSSKFGRASLVKICSLREVSRIVTDSGLPPEMEKRIREKGVELILASAEEGIQ